MIDFFQAILAIQECDMNMIRLVRVKRERQKEAAKLRHVKQELSKQVADKEEEIATIKRDIRMGEMQIKETQEKIVKLESQQAAVKKMDEFNALTQEMTAAGRERNALEHRLSDFMDKLATEEDLLVTLKENLTSTESSSALLEGEIQESIEKINEEGRLILEKREEMRKGVAPDLFEIYERLLKNKRDRVVVPIENRTCSGCHILLTPQHENLVRKGDRFVFCEHCSRILYWQREAVAEVGEEGAPRRRRRRTSTSSTSAS